MRIGDRCDGWSIIQKRCHSPRICRRFSDSLSISSMRSLGSLEYWLIMQPTFDSVTSAKAADSTHRCIATYRMARLLPPRESRAIQVRDIVLGSYRRLGVEA